MGRYSDLNRRMDKMIQTIKDKGGELIGVTSIENYINVSKAENENSANPFDIIKDAKSIIVIGLKMIDSIWDKLKGETDLYSQNARNYLMHYNYDQLDYIAVQTSRYIEACGYDAFPIQARSEDKSKGYLSGYFSFKSAAIAAGLGSKGKNSLIITKEYGPRIRWVAIITDMELPYNKPNLIQTGEICGTCKICIAACPKGAIFFKEESKEVQINKIKCQEHMDLCQCALCQGICPFGKEAAKKRRSKKIGL